MLSQLIDFYKLYMIRDEEPEREFGYIPFQLSSVMRTNDVTDESFAQSRVQVGCLEKSPPTYRESGRPMLSQITV